MNSKYAVITVGLLGIVAGGFVTAVLGPSVLRGRVTESEIRDVLRKNPDIVLDALRLLENRAQRRAAIVANRPALLEDTNSVVAGNPQGDVTVVEFFDYRCPYCRQAMTTVRELVKSDPKIRLVYKEFPILGPESQAAARVAIAARKDPRYEALHDALMVAPSPLGEEQALQIAAKLGFDPDTLAAASKAPEVDQIIRANHVLGFSLGIEGTPAFVIGDVLVPGVASLDELKKLVANVRARGGDQVLDKAS
jgi:protein-disulfide isomerase